GRSRHPCVEGVMDFASTQPFIHDVGVNVLHQLSSGRIVISSFRCYFKRHKRLPHNCALGVQGDLVIMRTARKDSFSVVNMRGSDREVAD
ncbi:hypothetical protein DFH09DRAFT_848742, partial [Mycena vulgaris]